MFSKAATQDLASPAPAAAEGGDIDTLDDGGLDALPYGVVCLDGDGTILRYNLYESRLARLDRNQVIGRNFFRDVAPCTRGEAFEGRFRAVVSSGEPSARAQFSYLFDFKFGAQQVEVEVVRAAFAPRFYLLINRREVLPARPGLPADGYAAQQRELAPDEARSGVRRDELEQRFVEVPWSVLAALRATCERLAPESWQLFCAEWGTQWGRRLAIDLESRALESRGVALRDLTMREVADSIAGRLAHQGWGQARFDFDAAREGVVVVELERSALAESAPRTRQSQGGAAPDLACHLVAGCLGGLMTHAAGRRLSAREIACRAGGAARCTFVIVSSPRRPAVDAALAAGARTLDAIKTALRRAPATRDGA